MQRPALKVRLHGVLEKSCSEGPGKLMEEEEQLLRCENTVKRIYLDGYRELPGHELQL